ncbi:MAG: hypothetical protein II840_02635 [Kiritimatiellae bacterium]|nr:hypothetical protein [Kiritimatiellia bacterium]
MNMFRASRRALGAFAVVMAFGCMFTGRASVLVSDGFSRTAAYPIAATQQGTLSNYPSTYDETIVGFNTGKKWLMYGSQPKVHGYDLRLPAAMSAAGFSSMGENCVGMNRGSANSKNRYGRHDLAADVLKISSGTIYVRALMHLDSTAASPMVNTSDSVIVVADGNVNYYGIGFSPRLDASQDAASCTSLTDANGAFGFFFLKNTAKAISLIFRVKSATGTVIERKLCDVSFVASGDTIAGGQNTYIAYAEIKIGAGANGEEIVRAGAKRVLEYNSVSDLTWATLDPNNNTEALTCDFMTDSLYPKALYFDGCYVSQGWALFDEIVVATTIGGALAAPETPALANESIAGGPATYTVSATVVDYAADDTGALVSDGANAAIPFSAGAVAAGSPFSATINTVALSPDTTYNVAAYAEKTTGGTTNWIGTLYTGELALGATTDAYEYGSVTGGVLVARASADPFPLTVNYTISGSAGTEGTTWAAPVAVTIPANATSALLPVVPLMDGDVTSDVTITVSLASGNYELPASNAATLTLFNLAAPAGKKTWVATANGNASDGANWSPSGAPTETDEILLDGNFSNARCVWDAAATHTVASWEQTAAFTGTVELQTTYESGAFASLAITGDCTISGGTVTQTKNEDVQAYRLSLTVGGDFSVASGAQITATGKGYDTCHYPAGSACGIHGGSANDLSLVYGDLKHPIDIGSAGSTSGFKGGGAIHLVVTGDATIDGTLAARPSTGSAQGDTRYKGHGAGGSIYLSAASVAGSGSITAAGYGFDSSWQRPGGAGGRIAVVCTTAASLAFPTANLMCNGSIAGYGNTTGAGTIFVKTASQQNGTLIVDNAFAGANFEAFWPTKRGVTPIPAGETWSLDEVQFRRYGVLCVPEGTTLAVPLSGVSATSDRTGGILYAGGTLDIGNAPYTLAGKWTFQADVPYTFDGDVTVTDGANIGGLRFSGNYTNDFAQCDVTVDGDLTIASGGYASVTMAGPFEANVNNGQYPRHGGQYATLSGNRCYGSVFAPVLPGYFAQAGDHATAGIGGGVLKLTVTGDLVVDGSVTAGSSVFHKSSAAAGSVNITAKTLSGSGSITANGAVGSITWDNGYNGVGGRIAVRVTGEDVGSTGVWSKFAALGCATNQVNTTNARNQNTSAGTIYLQGASDGEKGGTIYVKNKASYDTSNVATWIPAATYGDSAADFKKATLVIADRGVVAIGADIKFASVSVAANSKLDLHGQKVKVASAALGDTKLAAGTYTSASGDVSGFVVDSAGGGSLTVGGGFFMIIR